MFVVRLLHHEHIPTGDLCAEYPSLKTHKTFPGNNSV